MKFKEQIVTFRGCIWETRTGWEVEKHCAIHYPIRKYRPVSMNNPTVIHNFIKEACDQLCEYGEIRTYFDLNTNKMFEKRKWTFNLRNKRPSLQSYLTVRFFINEHGDRDYEVLEYGEGKQIGVERTSKSVASRLLDMDAGDRRAF